MSVNESVTDQVDAMRQGTLRPTTLVDQAITRIGQLNPAVNAVITMAEARAREEAESWDLAWSSGNDLPPLAGVPVLIKGCGKVELGTQLINILALAEDLLDFRRLLVLGALEGLLELLPHLRDSPLQGL